MRNLDLLQEFRAIHLEMKIVGDTGHPKIGFFVFKSPRDGRPLRCIVSAIDGWDHVSVSRTDRVPNWYEMSFIKEKFFEENEWAMQVHPPRSEWVNNHAHCLHLFRPHNGEIPKPPSEMVGYRNLNVK